MLPCVCSVKDHRWRQNVSGKNKGVAHAGGCVTHVFTTFWRPLCSITEQAHDNMESIRKSPKCYFSSLLLPFFLYFTWIQFLRKVFQRHFLLKADYYLWRKHFAKQRVCNYRLLLINLQSQNRHPVQISKGWNGHHSSSTYPSEPKKVRVVSYKELLRGLGSRDNNFFWWLIKNQFWFAL